MSSRIFQNVIIQLKDAVDRTIGVVDDQGFVVASSELAMIGSRLDDFRTYEFDGTDKIVTTAGKSYKALSSENTKLDYAAFVEGTDSLARTLCAVTAVAYNEAKSGYEEKHNKAAFVKNIISDNILPGDVYVRAKELHFVTDEPRSVLLVRQVDSADVAAMEVIHRLFPDKQKDFVININETDIVVVKSLSAPDADGDSLEELSQKLYAVDSAALAQTMELMDYEAIRRAADALESAERVCCMGQGGSMLIAEEAAHLFSTASVKFFAVSDSHMQMIRAANMGERDAVLFFSYSGATRDMMETLQVARERGACIILVTRFAKSPGGALADVVLRCGANESPLQLGSVAAKVAQLLLLDVLFAEYCRRAPEHFEANRERIAAALADKHL